MKLHPARLIAKKRDGGELSTDEIHDLVGGVVDGSLEPAQLGALLMAGFWRGSNAREIADWTRAMRDSGRVYSLASVEGPKVDKHSTGGVGDKVSLVLAPLVAACGGKVPMVSGRGLGHTGGTVDKLESIPGFSMQLTPEGFEALVAEIGVAMSSATADIAPADARMYATRDVTGTVESVPWIVSSILSKKLAEGIDALVLDVKCGRGAFMKDLASARELASSLVETAELCGCRTRALITDMDVPLGRAVGNALEVAEAVDCLAGGGPGDLRECVVQLASEMLALSAATASPASGTETDAAREESSSSAQLARARARAEAALDDGTALARFELMVERQGGDPRVARDPWALLPRAPQVMAIDSPRAGYLVDLDPFVVGQAAVDLGAGRRSAGDSIDPSVGIVCCAKPGDFVEQGQDLFEIHHAGDVAVARDVARRLLDAASLGDEAGSQRELVLERIA